MSQPCMSLPVAATNSRNSSTVTALLDSAIGWAIITQCSGFSNVEEFSAGDDPCSNRPVGSTVSTGQVGQSRIVVPGGITAAVGGAGLLGAGDGRCTTNQIAEASNTNAAPIRIARGGVRKFQRQPRTVKGNFGRSLKACATCVLAWTSARGDIGGSSNSPCPAAACHRVARFGSVLTGAAN